MDSDAKFWITVWTLVCIISCTAIVTLGITTYGINKRAFENGYESAALPGCGNGAHWVKAK